MTVRKPPTACDEYLWRGKAGCAICTHPGIGKHWGARHIGGMPADRGGLASFLRDSLANGYPVVFTRGQSRVDGLLAVIDMALQIMPVAPGRDWRVCCGIVLQAIGYVHTVCAGTGEHLRGCAGNALTTRVHLLHVTGASAALVSIWMSNTGHVAARIAAAVIVNRDR